MTTTTAVLRTDFASTSDVRITDTPHNRSATGYGSKIPTRYMLEYGGRWRRVYMMQYGNSGSAYVIVHGQEHFLDLDTEWFIQLYAEEADRGH
jgi:hypothetical protein